jgi:hypothetical protein
LVLSLAQLVFGGALRLVLAALGLLRLIAGYGSGSLSGLALCLVQGFFALVLAAALCAHVLLPFFGRRVRTTFYLYGIRLERLPLESGDESPPFTNPKKDSLLGNSGGA